MWTRPALNNVLICGARLNTADTPWLSGCLLRLHFHLSPALHRRDNYFTDSRHKKMLMLLAKILPPCANRLHMQKNYYLFRKKASFLVGGKRAGLYANKHQQTRQTFFSTSAVWSSNPQCGVSSWINSSSLDWNIIAERQTWWSLEGFLFNTFLSQPWPSSGFSWAERESASLLISHDARQS